MPKTVLLVDDDKGIQETLEAMLELEGYHVEVADDGLEALEKISRRIPDVLLLDLMLPRMSGQALAEELERRRLREQLRIVVVTADGRAQQKAQQVGADGYVVKPFSMNALLNEVARVAEM